ncbi:MAG TPA: hypothetical protein ENJ20_01125, partial [Bacteroidetes bacterium]|nr:hypothetical protein [Bacteroidota bacterium]
MNSRFLRVVLLFSVSIITATGLWAQLRLKLQLLPDGQTYGVFVRPDDGLVISDNSITASAQVTVVMPVAFTWDNLTNHNGSWISNAQVVAPSENPGAKYVSFGFQGDDPPVAYAPGEEILLFTFRNTGSCPEFLYLIDCGTPDESDPFCPPNSLQTNPGNDLVVFDFQNGNTSFYYYAGNYGEYAWDCHDADGDGIVNAHEDTNGNGVFDPAEDASDLFDPNDPSGDGGLQLSLQLLPGGNSWGVFARPVGGVVPSPNTTTLEGHTEIVAPAGFEIDSVVSHAGTWVHDTSLDAPQENPGRSYLGFTLLADDPPIQYHENEPTLLFTIYYSGNCPDSIHIMDETTDPLALACVPTQNNLCIFNKLNVIDEGAVPMAEYYYVGNYGLAAWNCHDSDGDGIPNAFEDTNGDGNFDPDEGETDPNDPCDPYSPEGAFLVYDGPVVTCAGQPVENATLTVEVETGTDLNTTYTVVYTDGIDVMTLTGYESGQPIPVLGFGGASYKLIAVTNA